MPIVGLLDEWKMRKLLIRLEIKVKWWNLEDFLLNISTLHMNNQIILKSKKNLKEKSKVKIDWILAATSRILVKDFKLL